MLEIFAEIISDHFYRILSIAIAAEYICISVIEDYSEFKATFL